LLSAKLFASPALKHRESEAKVASIDAKLCQDIVAIVSYRVYLVNEGAFANTSRPSDYHVPRVAVACIEHRAYQNGQFMCPARKLLEIVDWLVWPERIGSELHRVQQFPTMKSALMIPDMDAARYTLGSPAGSSCKR